MDINDKNYGLILISSASEGASDWTSLAAAPGGGFIAVWHDGGAKDGSGAGIYGRFLDENYQRVGNEFLINTLTEGFQTKARVATLSDGTFMVVWAGGDGSYQGQIFAHDVSKLGLQFTVGPWFISEADIIGSSVNTFLVLRSQTNDKSLILSVYSKTGEVLVPSVIITSNDGKEPRIVELSDGRFVAAWHEPEGPARSDIKARIFDGSGNILGAEFYLNYNSERDQQAPELVATENGGFASVWQSYSEASQSFEISFRIFDQNGLAITQEQIVNSTTIGEQSKPSIARADDGTFIVAWQSNHSGVSQILYQKVGSDGQLIGENGTLSVSGPGSLINENDVTLETLATGAIVAAWDNNAGDILARVFEIPTEALVVREGEYILEGYQSYTGAIVGHAETGSLATLVIQPSAQLALVDENIDFKVADLNGSGSVLVDGGTIHLSADNRANIEVGSSFHHIESGQGELLIENAGIVTASGLETSLLVGNTGHGKLVLDGGALIQTSVNGSHFHIGRWGGIGDVVVRDSSWLLMESPHADTDIQVGLWGGNGSLSLQNNSELTLTSGATSAWIRIGDDHATGEMQTDASDVSLEGRNAFVIVGDNSGDGTLVIDRSSTFNLTGKPEDDVESFVNALISVGQNGATGSMSIKASSVNLSATDAGMIIGDSNGAGSAKILDQAMVEIVGEYSFLNVGHDAGTGALEIASGTHVHLGAQPDTARGETTSAEIRIGGSWSSQPLGGNGTLRIDGSDTILSATASKVNVDIGRHGGSGTLEITSGGQVVLNGLSSTDPIEPGGRARVSVGEGVGSEGLLRIDGAGSVLSLYGHSTRIQVGESRGFVEYKFFAFEATTSSTGEATPVFKNSDFVRFYGDDRSGFEPVFDTLDLGQISAQSVGLEVRNLRDFFSYSGKFYSLQDIEGIFLTQLTLENGKHLDIVEFRFLTEFPGVPNSIFAYAAPEVLPDNELSAFLEAYPERSVPTDIEAGNFYPLSGVPGVQISSIRNGGEGELEVTNGASLELTSTHQKMWDHTERNHSEAQIKIGYYEGSYGVGLFSGENTKVNLEGHSADIVVGHNNGGTGRLDILDGAHVTIASVYEAGFAGEWSGAQLQIGSRWSHQPTGGDGDVLIGGLDTRVAIEGHSARALVGRGGGTGVLTVKDGASFVLSSTRQWEWVDEQRNHSNAEILVGEGAGSVGFANFHGDQTEINLSGHSATIYVGQNDGAYGHLHIRDGASVQLSALFEEGHGDDWSGAQLQVGSRWSDREEAGTGIVTVSGSTTTLGLFGHSSDIVVGHNGGYGQLTVSGGATVDITSSFQEGNPDDWSGSGISIGGSWSHQPRGGNGNVIVENASTTVNLAGHNAYIQIGESGGAGTLDIRSGAQVNISASHDETSLDFGGRSNVSVGEGFGSTGALKINGADSKLSLNGHSARIQVGEARELVAYKLPAMSVIWSEQTGTFESTASISFFGDETAGFTPFLGEYSEDDGYLDIEARNIKDFFEYNGTTYSIHDIAYIEIARAIFEGQQEFDLLELFFHQLDQEERSIIVSLDRTVPLATNQASLDALLESFIETANPTQFEPGNFYLLSDLEPIQTEAVRYGGSGALEVTNGAKLELISSHQHAWDETARNHSEAQINVGYYEGSAGTGLFSGLGTEVSLKGHAAMIGVGHNNGADGRLDILDGAYVKVESVYEESFGDRWSGAEFLVGSRWSHQPTGGTGEVNIGGIGTVLELAGHSTTFAVGFSDGEGQLAISKGAHVKLLSVYDSNIANEWSGASFHVGSRWDSQPAGGSGTATISASTLSLDGHSTIFHVGNGGVGHVHVDGGSTIDMRAVATASENWSGSWLSVGRGDEALQLSGEGKLVISGAGTNVNLEGIQSYLTIGSRGGSGGVEILAGASLELNSLPFDTVKVAEANSPSDTSGRSVVAIGAARGSKLPAADSSDLLVSGQNSILKVSGSAVASFTVGQNSNLVITDGGRVLVETTDLQTFETPSADTVLASTAGHLVVQGSSINEISAFTLNGGKLSSDHATFADAWLIGHGLIEDFNKANGFLELVDSRILVGDIIGLDAPSDQILPDDAVGSLNIHGDARLVRSVMKFDLDGSNADYLHVDGDVSFEDVTIQLALKTPSLDSYRLLSARNAFDISELSSVYFDESLTSPEFNSGFLERRWNSAEKMHELWYVLAEDPLPQPLDLRQVGSSGSTTTYGLFASEEIFSATGLSTFDFSMSFNTTLVRYELNSIRFDPEMMATINENDAENGTLILGGIFQDAFVSFNTPLLTFDATHLSAGDTICFTLSDTFLNDKPQGDSMFCFDPSNELTVTIVDRNGVVMADVEMVEISYLTGPGIIARISSLGDTSRVDLLLEPGDTLTAIDFTLLDTNSLGNFTLGSVFDSWTFMVNDTVQDAVLVSGIAPLGAGAVQSGAEVVLASFDTTRDNASDVIEFALTNIALNKTPVANRTFTADTGRTNDNGLLVFDVASGSDVVGDAFFEFDNISQPGVGRAVRAQDALEALRLAVGLQTTDGRSDPYTYISADFNQDGRVSSQDALEILKFAVLLPEAIQAEWIFIDNEQDLSHIDRRNVSYDEGFFIKDMIATTEITMTGILLGDVNASYVL